MYSAAAHAAHRCLRTGSRIFLGYWLRCGRRRYGTSTVLTANAEQLIHHAAQDIAPVFTLMQSHFRCYTPHSSAARLAVGTLLSAIITPHTVEARQNTSAAAAIFVTTGESAPSGALSFFLYTKFVNADPRDPSPLRFRTEGGSPPDTGSPSGY